MCFPDNTAVFMCGHVHSGQAPMALVYRDPEGDLQALCSGQHEAEEPVLVCWGDVVSRAPRLADLYLDVGQYAQQISDGQPWVIGGQATDSENAAQGLI